MKNNRLVYSTESGKICPSCRKPVSSCGCKKKKPEHRKTTKNDGTIRIQREVKGRKGKTVTIVYGFNLDNEKLKNLAKGAKHKLQTGAQNVAKDLEKAAAAAKRKEHMSKYGVAYGVAGTAALIGAYKLYKSWKAKKEVAKTAEQKALAQKKMDEAKAKIKKIKEKAKKK